MKPQKTCKLTPLSSSKLAKQNSFKLFLILIRNSSVIRTSVDPFVTTDNKFYFEGQQLHPLQIIGIMMNLLRYFSKSTCNLDRAKYSSFSTRYSPYCQLLVPLEYLLCENCIVGFFIFFFLIMLGLFYNNIVSSFRPLYTQIV